VAREDLGEAGFELLWQAGRLLTPDQAWMNCCGWPSGASKHPRYLRLSRCLMGSRYVS
jgi:hypothetical protein